MVRHNTARVLRRIVRVVHSSKVLVGALLVSVSMSTAMAATSEAVSTEEAAARLVDKVYQVFHQQFAQETNSWAESAAAFCRAPTPQGFGGLQHEFAELVADFAQIELYRAGPMLQENRQNRLFYWPDTRRVGERQLRALLAQDDVAQISEANIADKSVALQGLPVTERLLFSKSAEAALLNASDTASCHVLQRVAENMNTMAGQLSQGWQSDSEFVQSFLSPEAKSPYYRSEDEVLRAIVTQIVVGLDAVLYRKIQPMLEANPGNARKGPLWSSQQSLNMISGNLTGIQALLLESGLAEKTGLQNELEFEFRTAFGMLDKLKALPAFSDEQHKLTENAQSLLNSLSAVVSGIVFTVGDRFSAGLGVSAGFNSDDGD